MDSRILVMSNEVIKMIKVQLDPNTDQNQRLQAYQLYEEFKRKSPLCLEVGFHIFDKEQNMEIPVRLCGLQLVEWSVQNKWDCVEPTWRDEMKVNAIKLIELADFEEHDCLKGGIVKVVVEVIKRSWPQLWGSLFDDLCNLQSEGDAQLELVLIILMRLSEDLNGFDDKVKQQRRRDMVSTLNNHVGDLLHFFISTIHDKANKLKERINVRDNLRLTVAALNTIAEYASWVNFEFLITEEKLLFQVLFLLLEIDAVKSNTALCLCSIFERKGQPEKRVEMMVILSEDALSIIENAAHKAASKAELGDQEEYQFLKRLAEMLLHFGRSQIAALWGEDKGFKERPKCFDRYLKIMLDFIKHESLAINGLAAKLWHCLSFHKEISKDEMYLAAIEHLPKELLRMMSKLSHPNLTRNSGTKYTIMEIEGPEDFQELHNVSRRFAMDIIKQITLFIPQVILRFVIMKAEEYLTMEVPDVKGYNVEKILFTDHYLLWNAYQQFSRHFFIVLFESKAVVVTPDVVLKCNEYLKTLIGYRCDNPVLLTPVILTMETLFPIFKYSQDLLKPCLLKLSTLMQLPSDGGEQQRKIKRHAIIILTHLCKKSPELLADKFDDLYEFFGAKTRENIFTNHEKKLLIEGLLNVSKSLTDTVKMKGFIDEVFDVPLSFFKRDDMKQTFKDTSSFIKFLGLDVETGDEAEFARRNELILSLYTLEAAARALVITKEDTINDYPGNDEITRTISTCPWMQHMIDSLPYLFDIARQVCLLWTKADEGSAMFKEVLLQDQCEISAQVKKADAAVEEDDVGTLKMKPNKQFPVFAIHEAIYTSLSLYGRCLGPVLFSLPGMMNAFIEKVVKSWVHYPNYRMRKVWRAIIKAFSLQCPAKYYESVLAPFLAIAIEQMFERLSKEWPRVQKMVQGKQPTEDDNEDNDEGDQSSEILELRIMHNLSKEVLEILVSLCLFKRNKKIVKAAEDNVDIIGPLGEFLLTYPQTNLRLITMFFTALTWPDSSVVDRVCTTISAIVKKMFVPENPVNPEIPNQMLLRLLQGLQTHGADQTAQSAIVNATLAVYLQMRQQYPSIVHVMMMVPTCREEDLKNFDISMFIEVTNINESTKRKRFRKFLQGAIGKTVSELHKNDMKIQDLPPLAPRVKPSKPDLIIDAEDASLCQLFAPDD